MSVLRRLFALIALVLSAPAAGVHAADTVPPPPADAYAAKVYAILDQHCAKCHQFGKVAGAAPAAGFGNILHLDQLALDPELVRPGNPDGSKLYTTVLMRMAPHDGETGGGKAEDMQATELDAVRTWIQGLAPVSACQDRPRITATMDSSAAIAALDGMAPEKAKSQRFVTISALHNACTRAEDMAVLQEGLGRVINSLSWALDPVALQPVNEAKTLFRVDLTNIGWDATRWERLVNGYGFRHASGGAEKLAAATGTMTPLIRADWLAATALRAPLYYDLLGLPDRLPSLLASLRINLAADVAAGKARRYGLRASAVARGSRFMQRHEFANGPAWISFEYAPTPGRQDVFDTPGGPGEAGSPTRSAPKPDASLLQFALPSGFTAFYMANADGQRVNDIANSVLKDDAHPATRIGSALSCFGCHADGVRGADDQLREKLAADTLLPKDQREKLLTLHGTAQSQQLLFRDDRELFAKALRAAQLTPGLTLYGIDPVSALAQRYERSVSQLELADTLHLDQAGIAALETGAKGDALDLLQRLRHGLVARRDVTANLPALYALTPSTDGDTNVRPQTPAFAAAPSRPDAVDVVLKASKASYRAGDLLTITARASATCNMTIVNVDATGRGTVVFPNDFEQNNIVEAGSVLRLPSDAAPYQFRLKDKGRETIIAVCSTAQKSADGIVHDFEKQRFTELGDYRAFISRAYGAELDDRRASPRGADPKARRTTRRGRADPPASAKDEKPAVGAEVRDVRGRTAIQIEIN
jgi:transcriptional regulator with XRE-family HTH domain/mono/diheme cytochrome c family protein